MLIMNEWCALEHMRLILRRFTLRLQTKMAMSCRMQNDDAHHAHARGCRGSREGGSRVKRCCSFSRKSRLRWWCAGPSVWPGWHRRTRFSRRHYITSLASPDAHVPRPARTDRIWFRRMVLYRALASCTTISSQAPHALPPCFMDIWNYIYIYI